MIQLLFGEVRLTGLSPSPVLLLRERDGVRRLPVWVGAPAAAAIMGALEPESPEYPSTHDLLLEILATQSAVVERLDIVGERDGVFEARLSVNATVVACRLSDGVALALRCGAPIYVAKEVLDACGVAAGGAGADEVEQFREFLANVNADDFDRDS